MADKNVEKKMDERAEVAHREMEITFSPDPQRPSYVIIGGAVGGKLVHGVSVHDGRGLQDRSRWPVLAIAFLYELERSGVPHAEIQALHQQMIKTVTRVLKIR